MIIKDKYKEGKLVEKEIALLTYCGLYCGACPSYYRGTCFGCRSEDSTQKRKSKWGCKIRQCCKNKKVVKHCGECLDFPCKEISRKLIYSHPKDPKFAYRHEIPKNITKINEIGMQKWIKLQKKKWECPICGGSIVFYDYRCKKCGNNNS